MNECIGNKYIFNQQTLPCSNFSKNYSDGNKLSIYEVVRVEDGIPAFINDHLSRLFNSLRLKNINISEKESTFIKNILILIRENNIRSGRIKIVLQFPEYPENKYYKLFVYQIETTFPPDKFYKEGVKTILCNAIRTTPNVKIVNTEAKNKANKKIKETGVYEALLLNPKGHLTEGSRSNLFFIKKDHIFTPHDANILQGIARKNVIEICSKKEMDLIIKNIHYIELADFDTAFLTGTSPKVLPIRQINDLKFNVDNPLLRTLMKEYDKKLKINLAGIKKIYYNLI